MRCRTILLALSQPEYSFPAATSRLFAMHGGTEVVEVSPELQFRRPSIQSSSQYSLSVAIDFGTSRSGIAYCFSSDPDKVIAQQQWPNAPHSNLKTLTNLLLDESMNILAFGDNAQQMYLDMDPSEQKSVLYFERFKMKLYFLRSKNRVLQSDKNDLLSIKIPASNGKEISLLLVLTKALQFMKEFALQLVNKVTDVAENEILFVVTVPAIWDFLAKQLVREAATRAGIMHYILALEPEAAAISCVREQMDVSANFKEGCEYVVVDCGGGTLDVVAHRHKPVESGGWAVEEILPASGGPWGSNLIDENFVGLLKGIFGESFMNQYINEHTADWLYILRSWEVSKVSFLPVRDHSIGDRISSDASGRSSITEKYYGIVLSVSFTDLIMEKFGSEDSIKQRINQFISLDYSAAESDVIKYQRGRIRLKEAVLIQLYLPVVNKIVSHVYNLFQSPALVNCKLLFLVGGMASCSLLVNGLEETLGPDVRVVSPQQPDLAVVMGAALYGMSQDAIISRISKKTFGMKVVRSFDGKVHPIRKKRRTPDGKDICGDLFLKFIEKGTSLPVDHIVTKTVRSLKGLDVAVLGIYASDVVNPEFIDDSEVTLIGSLIVQTVKDSADPIVVEMQFGQTDLYVSAFNAVTKQKLTTNMEFVI